METKTSRVVSSIPSTNAFDELWGSLFSQMVFDPQKGFCYLDH
jgi:hypothetical protein